MQITSDIAAIVTGGASGLGEATARRLAGAGVRVAIFDMNAGRGEKVAADIGGLYCHVDVASEDSVDAGLAAARERHGAERILVNCAGIAIGEKTVSRDRKTGAIQPHRLANFTRVVTVNLVGTFHMISRSAAAMMALEPVTADGGRSLIAAPLSIDCLFTILILAFTTRPPSPPRWFCMIYFLRVRGRLGGAGDGLAPVQCLLRSGGLGGNVECAILIVG